MIHIAIDPGLTGAVAAIDDQAQLVLCADLPVIRDNKLAWIDSNEMTSLLLQCRDGRPAQITVERSQSMPGQGVSSHLYHWSCSRLDPGSLPTHRHSAASRHSGHVEAFHGARFQ